MVSMSSKRRRPLGEHVDDLVEVLDARVDRREPRVVDEVGATGGLHVELERALPRGMTRDHDVVTLGCRDHGIVTGSERGHVVVDRTTVQVPVRVLVDREHRLGHRDVDALPDSRLLAVIERGEDRRQALERGVHVAVREHVVGDRAVARLPLRPRDAGLGLHDRCVRAASRPRALLPVAADRRDDEPGMGGEQLVGVEAHACHHARTEVLEHHIGHPGERAHDRDRFGLREVEADVSLPAVLLREVRRHRVLARPREPRHVTLGRLDLDDVRTHVDEHAPAVRTGEHA